MSKVKLIKEIYGPLKLFNQKAQKLQNLSFIKQYNDTKNAVSIKATKHPEYGTWNIEIDSKRANDESIEAVSLTLRFFIQDNEKCSFRNLSNLYQEIEPLVGLRNQYEFHRSRLNAYLSQEAQPQPARLELGRPLLLRDVLEIFMYGGLAHANENKKRIYDTWMKEPVACAAYTHVFHRIIHDIITIIRNISELNNVAISRLRNVVVK